MYSILLYRLFYFILLILDYFYSIIIVFYVVGYFLFYASIYLSSYFNCIVFSYLFDFTSSQTHWMEKCSVDKLWVYSWMCVYYKSTQWGGWRETCYCFDHLSVLEWTGAAQSFAPSPSPGGTIMSPLCL